jgi:hypothetical protein
MGKVGDVERAVRGAGNPKILGDWLAGLFALAREEILDLDGGAGVVKVIDEIVGGMTDRDFLVALPSLRQAFVFFPPRERQAIAKAVLSVRGETGSANVLLRASADPAVLAWALEVEQRADDVLRRESLVDMEGT